MVDPRVLAMQKMIAAAQGMVNEAQNYMAETGAFGDWEIKSEVRLLMADATSMINGTLTKLRLAQQAIEEEKQYRVDPGSQPN